MPVSKKIFKKKTGEQDTMSGCDTSTKYKVNYTKGIDKDKKKPLVRETTTILFEDDCMDRRMAFKKEIKQVYKPKKFTANF